MTKVESLQERQLRERGQVSGFRKSEIESP